jgi:hypothetical protein
MVKKCCPHSEIFNVDTLSCVENPQNLNFAPKTLVSPQILNFAPKNSVSPHLAPKIFVSPRKLNFAPKVFVSPKKLNLPPKISTLPEIMIDDNEDKMLKFVKTTLKEEDLPVGMIRNKCYKAFFIKFQKNVPNFLSQDGNTRLSGAPFVTPLSGRLLALSKYKTRMEVTIDIQEK